MSDLEDLRTALLQFTDAMGAIENWCMAQPGRRLAVDADSSGRLRSATLVDEKGRVVLGVGSVNMATATTVSPFPPAN